MKLVQLIKEIDSQGKTLHAFDLDDTLIKSSSKVIVKTPDGIKKLTPAEYALYEPRLEDELDFSEFSQIKDPTLIRDNVKIFLDALRQSSSISKTIILTARTPDITDDIQDLLDFKNLPQVEIHAVGSSDPQKKADVIQDFINKGFTQVRFFDDSPANVKAVNALRPSNPNVDIRTKLVVHTLDEAGKGLWHNIRAKRARGEKPSHPNSKAFKSAVQAGKEILRKEGASEVLKGGLADDLSLEDIAKKHSVPVEKIQKEFDMGVNIEMEHTGSKKMAKEIAKDHLFEKPDYYSQIKKLKLEGVHDPVNPGILKKRLGKLSCTKVKQKKAGLEDKGTDFAKALQRYINYQDC